MNAERGVAQEKDEANLPQTCVPKTEGEELLIREERRLNPPGHQVSKGGLRVAVVVVSIRKGRHEHDLQVDSGFFSKKAARTSVILNWKRLL